MIFISDYNPEWPHLFDVETRFIASKIGHLVKSIEHIGSTAIPDLAAKPVIDIMIGVYSLKDIDAHAIQLIESLHYNYIQKYEIEMPYRRFFQKNNKENTRTHHIHLVEYDNDFWKKHLLFRDYLREHPEEAKKYETCKRDLAKHFTDTNEYAKAKTMFIEEIHHKASQWRKNSE